VLRRTSPVGERARRGQSKSESSVGWSEDGSGVEWVDSLASESVVAWAEGALQSDAGWEFLDGGGEGWFVGLLGPAGTGGERLEMHWLEVVGVSGGGGGGGALLSTQDINCDGLLCVARSLPQC
jgi:hypothetical protein